MKVSHFSRDLWLGIGEFSLSRVKIQRKFAFHGGLNNFP